MVLIATNTEHRIDAGLGATAITQVNIRTKVGALRDRLINPAQQHDKRILGIAAMYVGGGRMSPGELPMKLMPGRSFPSIGLMVSIA